MGVMPMGTATSRGFDAGPVLQRLWVLTLLGMTIAACNRSNDPNHSDVAASRADAGVPPDATAPTTVAEIGEPPSGTQDANIVDLAAGAGGARAGAGGGGAGTGGLSGAPAPSDAGNPAPDPLTQLAAPNGLRAHADSSMSITLTWSDVSENEDGFSIERSLEAGTFAEIARVAADTQQFRDVGLMPASSYKYRIAAVQTNTRSPYSAVASATTLSPCAESSVGTWARAYAAVEEITANAAIAAHGGGYVLAGTLDLDPDTSTHRQAWVTRVGADGKVCWSKTYGTPQDGYRFNAISDTADGGYIATGVTVGSPSLPGGYEHTWVVKLDAIGDIEWQVAFGADAYSMGAGLKIIQTDDDADGARDDGYALAAAGVGGIRVMKLSARGEAQWSAETSAIGSASVGLRQLDDRNYVLTGFFDSAGAGVGVALIKPTGESERQLVFTSVDRVNPTALEIAPDGGFVVTGFVDLDPSTTIQQAASS
jgi:hypothetical protein